MKIPALLLLATTILACSTQALAMEPCRKKEGCIDDASAGMIAAIDVYGRRCAEAMPDKADEYHLAVALMLAGEVNAGFLDRLRDYEGYKSYRARFDAVIDGMNEPALRASCEEMFKKR